MAATIQRASFPYNVWFTAILCTKRTGSCEFQFKATHYRLLNNFLYATAQEPLINDFTSSAPDPAAVDYNLYSSTIGAQKAKFVWQRTRYTGNDNSRQRTGVDRHSPPFSDPQFIPIGTPPDLDIAPLRPPSGLARCSTRASSAQTISPETSASRTPRSISGHMSERITPTNAEPTRDHCRRMRRCCLAPGLPLHSPAFRRGIT